MNVLIFKRSKKVSQSPKNFLLYFFELGIRSILSFSLQTLSREVVAQKIEKKSLERSEELNFSAGWSNLLKISNANRM